jgi:hypothetical protein
MQLYQGFGWKYTFCFHGEMLITSSVEVVNVGNGSCWARSPLSRKRISRFSQFFHGCIRYGEEARQHKLVLRPHEKRL